MNEERDVNEDLGGKQDYLCISVMGCSLNQESRSQKSQFLCLLHFVTAENKEKNNQEKMNSRMKKILATYSCDILVKNLVILVTLKYQVLLYFSNR